MPYPAASPGCQPFSMEDYHGLMGEVESHRAAVSQRLPSEAWSQTNTHYASFIMLPEETIPRRHSRRSRTPSSSAGTAVSSNFDFSDNETMSSMSTAPPRRGPVPVYDNRPELPMPPPVSAPLVCEFVPLGKCQRIFDSNDVEGWIKHNAKHFDKKYPDHCMCWICGKTFNAANKEDRRSTYRNRMKHIANHFEDGYGREYMGPDCHFLQHLRAKGVISSRTYEKAIGKHYPKDMHLCPPGTRLPPRSLTPIRETHLEPSRSAGDRYRVLSTGKKVFLD